jgi:hypothetical protein
VPLLNKYAATMLASTNNGVTFNVLSNCSYCPKFARDIVDSSFDAPSVAPARQPCVRTRSAPLDKYYSCRGTQHTSS